jgi:hypothetical protein
VHSALLSCSQEASLAGGCSLGAGSCLICLVFGGGLDILRLLAGHCHWHIKSTSSGRVVCIILIKSRWGEVLERDTKGLLLLLLLEIILRWQDGLHITKVRLLHLLVKERCLHGLEHELLLTPSHHLVARILLLAAVKEDPRRVLAAKV